jgi:predicted acetyltransferase
VAIEIRAFTEDEFDPAYKVLFTAFGEVPDDESKAAERLWFEHDRSLAAVDGGAIVGTAGAYTFDMTLPGGTTTPVAGVTWVGVLPTHRRRGILRSMMAHQLDDVVERGEAIAVLTASEAVIYGRFGYGVATRFARAEVRQAVSAFAAEPALAGTYRLYDSEGARKVVPAIHEGWRRSRAGLLSRSDRYWDAWATDPKEERDGATARNVVVHEDAGGRADGYAAYRVKQAWTPEKPGGTVVVHDVTSTDPEVEAGLLRFLLDIDLIWDVQLRHRPLDDPLRWRLADPRSYHTTQVFDWLWVRVLDVPAALSTRRYATDDRVVIELADAFRPETSGVYVVEGGPDGATCSRASAGTEPAIRLPTESLGAAYLGGVRFTTLAEAGRAAGARADLERADRFFATTPDPFCDLGF